MFIYLYVLLAIASLLLAGFGIRYIDAASHDLEFWRDISRDKEIAKLVYGRREKREQTLQQFRTQAKRQRLIGIFCLVTAFLFIVSALVIFFM